MKKIFIVLAAVAAVAACAKSEVEYTASEEITFTPVAKNITKAMMEGTTFNTAEQFNVWAFYNPTVTANSNIAAWVKEYNENADNGAKLYIEDKTFAYDNSYSLWAGVTPYFWPKVGTLAFAGYHPTAANASYTLSSEKNQMTFSDVNNSWVSADTTNTEDLMYFNLTQCYSKNNVTAVFKHALSWLTVNLATTKNTLDAEATVKVNSVKFTDVYPQGDGVVNNQEVIAWTTEGTQGDVEVVDAEGGITLTVAPQKQNEPLFIPQTMAGNLVVNYTISSTDSSSFTENKVIALSGMKDSNGNSLSSWEPAKHYIYNIVISTEEILIDASVADWTTVVIPVNIPETNN